MPDVIQAAMIQVRDMVILQRVKYLPANFSTLNQVQVTQAAQLVRYGRFAQPDPFGDCSDVQFPTRQGGDNPHPGCVTQGSE
jgi:hypothetical protein